MVERCILIIAALSLVGIFLTSENVIGSEVAGKHQHHRRFDGWVRFTRWEL